MHYLTRITKREGFTLISNQIQVDIYLTSFGVFINAPTMVFKGIQKYSLDPIIDDIPDTYPVGSVETARWSATAASPSVRFESFLPP